MQRIAATAIALLLCAWTAPGASAAQTATPSAAALTPPARAADVASIDAIIDAVYQAISGPAGAKRDFDRLRSLFVPGARMIPVQPDREGGLRERVLTVEEYILRAGPLLERVGFRERELARRSERFGGIAHVWSTYEGVAEREMPPVRGINSIQLMNDGSRWWIVNIFWQAETPGNPLPEEYLRNE